MFARFVSTATEFTKSARSINTNKIQNVLCRCAYCQATQTYSYNQNIVWNPSRVGKLFHWMSIQFGEWIFFVHKNVFKVYHQSLTTTPPNQGLICVYVNTWAGWLKPFAGLLCIWLEPAILQTVGASTVMSRDSHIVCRDGEVHLKAEGLVCRLKKKYSQSFCLTKTYENGLEMLAKRVI